MAHLTHTRTQQVRGCGGAEEHINEKQCTCAIYSLNKNLVYIILNWPFDTAPSLMAAEPVTDKINFSAHQPKTKQRNTSHTSTRSVHSRVPTNQSWHWAVQCIRACFGAHVSLICARTVLDLEYYLAVLWAEIVGISSTNTREQMPKCWTKARIARIILCDDVIVT